jgi:PTH1 family peptidyl-tRNA hydrolase
MLRDVPPFSSIANWQKKFKGEWASAIIENTKVIVLLPHTMMNRSGESVQMASSFFKKGKDEIAVAHDDVELPFGEIGLRHGGGLAGHNGLRSIAQVLGGSAFWRIRVGVGRPVRGELRNHVLGRFSQEEEAKLPTVLESVGRVVVRGYRDGFETVPTRATAAEV